jgi:hypothetical protein
MLDHYSYQTVSQHFQNLPLQFRQPSALFLSHRSGDPTHRNLDTLQHIPTRIVSPQLAWCLRGQMRPLHIYSNLQTRHGKSYCLARLKTLTAKRLHQSLYP